MTIDGTGDQLFSSDDVNTWSSPTCVCGRKRWLNNDQNLECLLTIGEQRDYSHHEFVNGPKGRGVSDNAFWSAAVVSHARASPWYSGGNKEWEHGLLRRKGGGREERERETQWNQHHGERPLITGLSSHCTDSPLSRKSIHVQLRVKILKWNSP